MDKKEVAIILEKIALMLELKGENTFKIRAYQNGARSIETLEKSLQELVEKKELKKVQGIGQAINEKVTELIETGEMAYYQELEKEFPETIFDLFNVAGLGPKKDVEYGVDVARKGWIEKDDVINGKDISVLQELWGLNLE